MEQKLFPQCSTHSGSARKTDHIDGQSTLSSLTCFHPIQKTPSLCRDFQLVVSLTLFPRQKFQHFHFATNFSFLSCNVFFRIILTKLHLFSRKYFVCLEKSFSANIAFIAFSQGSFDFPFLKKYFLHKLNISRTGHFNSPNQFPFPISSIFSQIIARWKLVHSRHLIRQVLFQKLSILECFHQTSPFLPSFIMHTQINLVLCLF